MKATAAAYLVDLSSFVVALHPTSLRVLPFHKEKIIRDDKVSPLPTYDSSSIYPH